MAFLSLYGGFLVSIPRRSPLTWVMCALLSGGAWALLLTRHADAGLGLMFAGGWNLSLLPVHAMQRARGARRRAASPPRG